MSKSRELPFSKDLREVLTLAQTEAFELGESEVGAEHLLLGILRQDDSPVARVLNELGVKLMTFREAAQQFGSGRRVGPPGMKPRAREAVAIAVREAQMRGHRQVEPVHLLLGLLAMPDGTPVGILSTIGIDLQELRRRVSQVIGTDR